MAPQILQPTRVNSSKPPRQVRPHRHHPNQVSMSHIHRRLIAPSPAKPSSKTVPSSPTTPRLSPPPKSSPATNATSALPPIAPCGVSSAETSPPRCCTTHASSPSLGSATGSPTPSSLALNMILNLTILNPTLVFMCFGERLDEGKVRDVEGVQMVHYLNPNQTIWPWFNF